MDGPTTPQINRLLDLVEEFYLQTIDLTDEEFEDILQAIQAKCDEQGEKAQKTGHGFVEIVRSCRADFMAILRGEK